MANVMTWQPSTHQRHLQQLRVWQSWTPAERRYMELVAGVPFPQAWARWCIHAPRAASDNLSVWLIRRRVLGGLAHGNGPDAALWPEREYTYGRSRFVARA